MGPFTLFCYDQAVIHVATCLVLHERANHTELDYHVVYEKITYRLIHSCHIARIKLHIYLPKLWKVKHFTPSWLTTCQKSIHINLRRMSKNMIPIIAKHIQINLNKRIGVIVILYTIKPCIIIVLKLLMLASKKWASHLPTLCRP